MTLLQLTPQISPVKTRICKFCPESQGGHASAKLNIDTSICFPVREAGQTCSGKDLIAGYGITFEISDQGLIAVADTVRTVPASKVPLPDVVPPDAGEAKSTTVYFVVSILVK